MLPACGSAAAPGAQAAGLDPASIAHVLYSWQEVYQSTGLKLVEKNFLLLTDGTARRGVPTIAPEQFDLAADRAAHPADWGRWRRAGDKLEVSFDGRPFSAPVHPLLREPGRSGEKLNRRYEASANQSWGIGSASWQNWSVEFSADGTFRQSSSGGVGASVGGVTGVGVRDDKGSATSVGGANVGGGASSSTGVTDADLTGHYTIDGWSITLHYNNGKIQHAFFYTDATRDNVWFRGRELNHSED